MYRRDDPRLRRRLDQFSHNVESATEHAQENLYTFSQNYITPCFTSIEAGFRSCISCCFPVDDTRQRRQRGRSRGLAESSFDFYDDWDEDNDPLSWTNSSDELDRLLAGPQPGRERAMSYGTRRVDGRARRKSTTQAGSDPNIITASHYIGFLDRLPFVGRKGLRYKPSAADLQEHPSSRRDATSAIEEEPLMEDSEEEMEVQASRKHKRNRSDTATSGHTTSSLSSRGDLFPSEDEDDAIPLDDEFDIVLGRRTTGSGGDGDSRRSRSGKSKSNSRLSIRTMSSKSMQSTERKTSGLNTVEPASPEVPSLTDLKLEEERARIEEEQAVEKKREAAKRLALQRGLSSREESKTETRFPSSPPTGDLETIPFSAYGPSAVPTTPREDTNILPNDTETHEQPALPTSDPPVPWSPPPDED
ncbi:Obg-like ATPase 1 [Venturia nashicola]|uniref:Obg-like ATPase 1 n=1 Tax=Venturia nashicola TaxID=86259 RepID=A0A4Z1PES2_9PEZI|nr:Obg-like ATPase 1 [Venturia nashicola]